MTAVTVSDRSETRKSAGMILLRLLIGVLFISASTSLAAQAVWEVLPAPVSSSEFFPCSRCHGQEITDHGASRKSPHGTVAADEHIAEIQGCSACHDKEDPDRLVLFSGRLLELGFSSELCGQCHSTNFTLWQSGLHGKVTGKWNGPRKIAPCTGCHDPHRPGYTAHAPESAPTPPEKTLRWSR